jgi:uncharacterized protein (TIGR04255 family)
MGNKGFMGKIIYKRDPITEAVIEIRTKAVLDSGDLERLASRFSRKFPASPQKTFDWTVEIGEVAPKADQKLTGYRLYSADGSRILVLGLHSIGTAKAAPYEGWDNLIQEARSNWDIWLKIVGWTPVTRIGVRFVNRIDIPILGLIELDDYITFQPTLPPVLDKGIRHFAMNASVPLGKDNLNLVLNAGSTPSPIIGRQSLILDLDVSRALDLPGNDTDLWASIESMRDRKNEVFEACITDRTRALLS